MRVDLFDPDVCLDFTACPTQPRIATSYNVDENGVDTRIIRHDGDEGGYPTFGEAKEAAIEWLESLKDMCDDRIDEIRSAETYEDGIRLGVSGSNPDDVIRSDRASKPSSTRDVMMIHWLIDSGWLHTHGMESLGFPELEVRHVPAFLAEDAAHLLRHVCDYMLDSGKRIKPGETMATSPRTALKLIKPEPMPGQKDHYKAERLQIVAVEPTCDCCGGKRSAATSRD